MEYNAGAILGKFKCGSVAIDIFGVAESFERAGFNNFACNLRPCKKESGVYRIYDGGGRTCCAARKAVVLPVAHVKRFAVGVAFAEMLESGIGYVGYPRLVCVFRNNYVAYAAN